MDQSTGNMKSRQPQTFLFRGNAVAAGGYLTKLKGVAIALDRQHVTVHGESNLPMIGGISHSLVENPELRFPEFISYNQCSTIVEGFGDARSATTNLHAAVNNVRTTTSPSPSDAVPDLQSISFRATNLAISARSIYPVDDYPSFELLDAPVTTGMSLVLTPFKNPPVVVPLRLEIDRAFLTPTKMDDLDKRFMEEQEFFDNHAAALQSAAPLTFGESRLPRTVEGYVLFSFVTKIFRGDQEILGNVLIEKGFGTITFGTVVTDSYSRRVDLVRIKMGSDPEGRTDFCGACSNGIWS
jgi:hypothetical protein